jgi:hypothetical protein
MGLARAILFLAFREIARLDHPAAHGNRRGDGLPAFLKVTNRRPIPEPEQFCRLILG